MELINRINVRPRHEAGKTQPGVGPTPLLDDQASARMANLPGVLLAYPEIKLGDVRIVHGSTVKIVSAAGLPPGWQSSDSSACELIDTGKGMAYSLFWQSDNKPSHRGQLSRLPLTWPYSSSISRLAATPSLLASLREACGVSESGVLE